MGSVGALLLLCLYIYSVLGVYLFAEVKQQQNLKGYANFQSFGLAFLTLLRCSTGESWNSIMMDTMRRPSILFQCDDSSEFDYSKYVASDLKTDGCGDPTTGLFFFLSFYVVVPLIFLNLFIAIILEGFTMTNASMS
jgi:voltage-dependent calcium channel L type alpha-1F